MPWMPYFEKVQQADIFVILNHCQFRKNNFQNRFNIEDKWYTLGVIKGNDPIIEKKYKNPKEDWESIKRKLPHHKNILNEFDDCISDSLWETNNKIIKLIIKKLNIPTQIEADYPTEKKQSERLLDICKKFNATTYLSGPSGRNYLDLNLFKEENIEVIYCEGPQSIKKPILECLTK
jgi:hypothetical protein